MLDIERNKSWCVGNSKPIGSIQMTAIADVTHLAKAVGWLYKAAKTPDEPLSLPAMKSVEEEIWTAYSVMTDGDQIGSLSFEWPSEQPKTIDIPNSITVAYVSGVIIGEKFFAYSARAVCSPTSGALEWRSEKLIPISVSMIEGPQIIEEYKQYAEHIRSITGAMGIMVRELSQNTQDNEM